MVALNCPLCCNETFSSHTSLKCHILNILENLMCPSCDQNFCKLSDLADHLQTDCSDKTEVEIEKYEQSDENPDNDNPQDSILARALLASPRNDAAPKEETNETQYYCQMCNVYFDDINQHLKEFHEGQEIIVEEEKDETVDTEEETIIIVDQEGSVVEDIQIENKSKTNQLKKLNTVDQQDFKDKDGRLYTRKFVKIDKFWLQNDSNITKNETNEIQEIDKASLIEINKCSNCNLFFSTTELHKNHNCSADPELKCDPCNLLFDDVEILQEHLKSHGIKSNTRKVGPFKCEVCNTTFPTFKSLRLHRRMHDPIKTREIEAPSKYGLFENDVSEEQVRHMFVCKICNKTYDKQYEAVHMNSHNANNGFNCEVCNRKFFTQTNLDMHMKAHSNNKKFTCSYCKKPFITYDALNDHLLHQCQKRPYACQFCGRRFGRPHEKVKHERIHTGEKPHVCDICGKAFRVSYCLTLHLRTHSGTRPYQCKHCGKRFKSHSVYNHHLLTHSDVRAYKCPYCPKAFKTSVQLAGHKNSHIKPFTCTECNRPFASLYAVRAHMETHKRDNNLKYECMTCGALYSRAFALRDHLKQQHQVEGNKGKAVALSVKEEMEATNSILVNEDDIILGLDETTNIEIIENETD